MAQALSNQTAAWAASIEAFVATSNDRGAAIDRRRRSAGSARPSAFASASAMRSAVAVGQEEGWFGVVDGVLVKGRRINLVKSMGYVIRDKICYQELVKEEG